MTTTVHKLRVLDHLSRQVAGGPEAPSASMLSPGVRAAHSLCDEQGRSIFVPPALPPVPGGRPWSVRRIDTVNSEAVNASGQSMLTDAHDEIVRIVEAVNGSPLTIRLIRDTVAAFFCVTPFDLVSQRRHRSIIEARQIAYYLAKEFTAHSLTAIGRHLGDKDHTSVLHGAARIKRRLEDGDQIMEKQIHAICARLGVGER